MRTRVKTTLAMLIFTTFISCKENQSVELNTPEEARNEAEKTADIADVEFGDGLMGKIWHNYLQIKMALTESDVDEVQQTADSMAETFSEELAVLKSLALKLSEADEIEIQRELFAEMTRELGPLFENDLAKGTIYKKLCPMALNDEGAYWYADIKEISNPYFGEEMPECGSIVKTISK